MDELDELIEKVRSGDPSAYAGVVERCEAKVRVVAAAILHNREAVADVAQETFVLAYGKIGEYKSGTNFHAWIATMARHLAMNQRTRYMRRLALEKKFQAEVEDLVQPAVDNINDGLEPDALLALKQCLEEMSLPSRDVVQKFYFDKSPTREISRAYGRPESWARVMLHRARVLLGECMKKKGVLTGEYETV